jgi:MinD-like ATPase involved in chromosome partitioning or flagellar assembly
MRLNGHPTTGLRILLSGQAADWLAVTLEQEPAISVIRPGAVGGASPSNADVALHVVESSSSPSITDDVRRVRELADVPLILAAYGEPNGIVETGLAVGAADVLVLPQPTETLLFAVRKAALAATPAASGMVVTVFSPKGGSGKTMVATNLAVAAARSGRRTLLVDLDLQFGDSALTLAVTPRATIADLAASGGTIDVDKLTAFVSTDPRSGLAVLPAPRQPEEADVVSQAVLAAVLDAARTSYQAIVIDTGPLFDSAMLTALDQTDRLLLVCNPEVTSLKNVRIGLETIDRLGFDGDRVSLVANRVGAPGALERSDIEHALEAAIAYELPDDPAVPAAVNRALPIVLADKKSKFSRALGKLASDVFKEPEPEEQKSKRRFIGGRR